MAVRSSRIWSGWMIVLAVGLAGLAHGAERAVAPAAEVPLHPLVAAAETLYLRGLPQACDEVLKLAFMALGLTDDDLIRAHFLAAMRDLDERNELGARRALSQALQLDRAAAPPPSSSSALRNLLDEVRAQLPPGTSEKSKDERLAAARKAASVRESAPKALLRAVDTLYVNLEIDGAAAVLELARSSAPLTAADRTQLALRRGILAMEDDEGEARKALREALEADPGALLPDYAPPKTRDIFEEVKRAVSTPATAGPAPGHPPAQPEVPATTAATPSLAGKPMANNSRTWGLAVGGGGAALVVGGAVAGAVALSAYDAEKRAAAGRDWDGYRQNRDVARTAVITANGLYGAGAVALGVGALLFFLSRPGDIEVGAGVGKGKVSLTVGGSF